MSWLTLAFGADPGEELTAALLLMAVGMAVVFAALVLLLAAITLIDRLVGTAEGQTQAVAGEAEGITPTLLAVLAAAATTALKRPVRVTHAQRRAPAEHDDE